MTELTVASLEQVVDRDGLKYANSLHDRSSYPIHCRNRVRMSAADRFGQDFVDQTEPLHVLGCQFQCLSGFFFAICRAPQDRSAAFWRNYAVPGVFHHGDVVANRNSQSTAGSALADHHDHDRSPDVEHLENVLGNRTGLPAFLGPYPWVSTRSVDETDDWQAQSFGETHLAQRLAVALGVCRAKMARQTIFRGLAFAMADQHDPLAENGRQTGRNRPIVAKVAISVQLDEILAEVLDKVTGERPIRVASDLNPIPRRQIAVNLGCEALETIPVEAQLFREVMGGLPGELFELFEPRTNVLDRLLKWKRGWAVCGLAIFTRYGGVEAVFPRL